LVDKVLNGITIVVKVEIDDKSIIEEVHYALEDAVSKILSITFLEELLHSILAQAFVLGNHLKVGDESRVLSIQNEFLNFLLLLSLLSLLGLGLYRCWPRKKNYLKPCKNAYSSSP
jgi:hypothetical protein